MLDEKDLQAIQNIISNSEARVNAHIDLGAGINGSAAPKSRIERLEEEVSFLRAMVMYLSADVERLKKAH